jgi:sialate O-acetylesterase
VVVSHPDVAAPGAVRYAWADVTDANLYDGANLPAAPFRFEE